MRELENIKVRVEVNNADDSQWATENALPLLHEIRHALRQLLESGETKVIDLRSLPMGPIDESQLLDTLGKGEAEAHVNAMGKSCIHETRYPGVWFVEHFNADEQSLGRFIEITFVPSFLQSQVEDIRQGLVQLTTYLQADDDA